MRNILKLMNRIVVPAGLPDVVALDGAARSAVGPQARMPNHSAASARRTVTSTRHAGEQRIGDLRDKTDNLEFEAAGTTRASHAPSSSTAQGHEETPSQSHPNALAETGAKQRVAHVWQTHLLEWIWCHLPAAPALSMSDLSSRGQVSLFATVGLSVASVTCIVQYRCWKVHFWKLRCCLPPSVRLECLFHRSN